MECFVYMARLGFVIEIQIQISPDILVHDGVVVADDAHLVLGGGVGDVAVVLQRLRSGWCGTAGVLPGAQSGAWPGTQDSSQLLAQARARSLSASVGLGAGV